MIVASLSQVPAEAKVSVTWRPDETLYSLLSRHHFFSGNLRPEKTILELFGSRELDLAHDVPAHTDLLVRQTRGTLGDATSLLFKRTILPYFLPLRSASQAQLATSALRAGHGRSQARWGMRHTSLCTSNPLKGCRQCMREDTDKHRSAYWHREHQWPGAMTCSRHGELLIQAIGSVYVGSRFDWRLPHDFKFVACANISHARTLPFFYDLTGCACGFGSLPEGFHFTQETLSLTYRKRLAEMDLAQPGGRLCHRKFCQYISERCDALRGARGFEILFQTGHLNAARFEHLLYPGLPATHPVLHVILISAVFESWQAFARSYASECLSMEKSLLE
jgi:hypothetical protein